MTMVAPNRNSELQNYLLNLFVFYFNNLKMFECQIHIFI